MAKPPTSGLRPCRTFGCSGRTPTRDSGRGQGPRFCDGCRELRDTPLAPPRLQGERDIEMLLVREAMAGGGDLTDRIQLYGPGSCVICDGPTIPGRLCCSSRCRVASKRGEGVMEVDGIEATPVAHARRLGINRTTFLMRLRRMSVREALARPVDMEMSRRSSG